ncbi:MAG: hypothetical protein U9Q34_01590, partial [Elusimicrobiota bacterium]|nr:hypothetical protein [Elusimicrobiota bacterium]
MRLYNAPRIIKAEIYREGKTIYNYDFTSKNNDNVTNYPEGVIPEKHPAMPGEFNVKLVFSAPMQTRDFPEFYVKFKSDIRQEVKLTGGWSRNNTWTGTGILEEGEQGIENIKLAVNAMRQIIAPGLDFNNQKLDTIGDGFSNGEDSFHNFNLINLPPYAKSVKLIQDGSTVYEAEWIDTETERTLNVLSSVKIENNSQVNIEINFNKPVKTANAWFERTSEILEISGTLSEDSKTWNSYVEAEDVKKIIEGEQKFYIEAQDISGRYLDGKPGTIAYYDENTETILNYENENDVDGFGGTDINHILQFKGEPPKVSVWAGKQLYSNIQGIMDGTQSGMSSPWNNAGISVSDLEPQSGISSVTIMGPKGFFWEFETPLSTGPFSADLGVLPDGDYTLSALDALGNETRVLFGVEPIDITLDKDSLQGTAEGLPWISQKVSSAKFGVGIDATNGVASVKLKKIISETEYEIIENAAASGETNLNKVYEVSSDGKYSIVVE